MIRLLLLVTFIFSLSNAAITLSGVVFDDYEENASNYFITYYPYQDILDLNISPAKAQIILNYRNSTSTLTPLQYIWNGGFSVSSDLKRIREKSHLIDWNLYTDSFGMTLHDTNFLYGLTGLLIGFGFYFGFITLITGRK